MTTATVDHPLPERIDVRRAFSFVFDDDRWVKKVLIGGLFALGPVLLVGIFFLIGYLVEVARRVSAGDDQPLPEWQRNYGTYFKLGVPAALGVLIWLAPFALVSTGAALVLGSGQSVPVQLVSGLLLLAATNLYAAIVVPSVIGRYAATGRFGSMFEVGRIIASIRRIGWGCLAVWLVHLAILGLTFATIWAIVAIMFTTAYAAMVFGHVYGQAMRISSPPVSVTSRNPASRAGSSR